MPLEARRLPQIPSGPLLSVLTDVEVLGTEEELMGKINIVSLSNGFVDIIRVGNAHGTGPPLLMATCLTANSAGAYVGTIEDGIIRLSSNGIPVCALDVKKDKIQGTISAMAATNNQLFVGTEGGAVHIVEGLSDKVTLKKAIKVATKPIVQLAPVPNGCLALDSAGNVFRVSKTSSICIFSQESSKIPPDPETGLPLIVSGHVGSMSTVLLKGRLAFTGIKQWLVSGSLFSTSESAAQGTSSLAHSASGATHGTTSPTSEPSSTKSIHLGSLNFSALKSKGKEKLKAFSAKAKAHVEGKDIKIPDGIFKVKGDPSLALASCSDPIPVTPVIALASRDEISLYALPQNEKEMPALIALIPIDDEGGHQGKSQSCCISCSFRHPMGASVFEISNGLDLVYCKGQQVAVISTVVEKNKPHVQIKASYSLTDLMTMSDDTFTDDYKGVTFISAVWLSEDYVGLLCSKNYYMSFRYGEDTVSAVSVQRDTPLGGLSSFKTNNTTSLRPSLSSMPPEITSSTNSLAGQTNGATNLGSFESQKELVTQGSTESFTKEETVGQMGETTNQELEDIEDIQIAKTQVSVVATAKTPMEPRALGARGGKNPIATACHTITPHPTGPVYIIYEGEKSRPEVLIGRVMDVLEQSDRFASDKKYILSLQLIVDHINEAKPRDLPKYIEEYESKASLAMNYVASQAANLDASGDTNKEQLEREEREIRTELLLIIISVFSGAFTIENSTKRSKQHSLVQLLFEKAACVGLISDGDPEKDSRLTDVSGLGILSLILLKRLGNVPFKHIKTTLGRPDLLTFLPKGLVTKALDTYFEICPHLKTDDAHERRAVLVSAILSSGVSIPYEQDIRMFAIEHSATPFTLVCSSTPELCPPRPSPERVKKEGIDLKKLTAAATQSASAAAQTALGMCDDIISIALSSIAGDDKRRGAETDTVRSDFDAACRFILTTLGGKSLLPRPSACLVDPTIKTHRTPPSIHDKLPPLQRQAFRKALLDRIPDGSEELVSDERIPGVRTLLALVMLRPEVAETLFEVLALEGNDRAVFGKVTAFLTKGLLGDAPIARVVPWQNFNAAMPYEDIACCVDAKSAFNVARLLLKLAVGFSWPELSSYQAGLLLMSSVSLNKFIAARSGTLTTGEFVKHEQTEEDETESAKVTTKIMYARMVLAALVESGLTGQVAADVGLFRLLGHVLATRHSFPRMLRSVRLGKFARLLSDLQGQKASLPAIICSAFAGPKCWPKMVLEHLQSVGATVVQVWEVFVRLVSLISGTNAVSVVDIDSSQHRVIYNEGSNTSAIFCPVPRKEKGERILVPVGDGESIVKVHGANALVSLHTIYIELLRSSGVVAEIPPNSLFSVGACLFSSWPGRLLQIIRSKPRVFAVAVDVLLFSSDSKTSSLGIDTVAISDTLARNVAECHSQLSPTSQDPVLPALQAAPHVVALFDPAAKEDVERRAKRHQLTVVKTGFGGITGSAYLAYARKVTSLLERSSAAASNMVQICTPRAEDMSGTCQHILRCLSSAGRLSDALELLSNSSFFEELDKARLENELRAQCTGGVTATTSGVDLRGTKVLFARVLEMSWKTKESFEVLTDVLRDDIRVYNATTAADRDETTREVDKEPQQNININWIGNSEEFVTAKATQHYTTDVSDETTTTTTTGGDQDNDICDTEYDALSSCPQFLEVLASVTKICDFFIRQSDAERRSVPSSEPTSPNAEMTRNEKLSTGNTTSEMRRKENWKILLTIVSDIDNQQARQRIVRGPISSAIQTTLRPRDAATCFLGGFANLKWMEMRDELLAFLNGVRTATRVASILADMSASEHSGSFRRLLEMKKKGVLVRGMCNGCGSPLVDPNSNLDECQIVVLGCGHCYHSECSPEECDCLA